MLRVATFNIRHGHPQGRRGVDLTGLAAAIASIDADVLALQEVDVEVPRSGRCDLARICADALPGRSVHFARAIGFQGGAYGNALVVRGTIDEVTDHPLPGEGERRVAAIARVTVRPDGHHAVGPVTTTVAVTHLAAPRGGRPSPAPAQLDHLLDLLDEQAAAAGGPQVLMGDLNLDRGAAGPVLAGRGWTAAQAPPTFPALRPRTHIDWVAVRGWEVRDATVPAIVASDHRPLVATLVRSGEGLGGTTRSVDARA